VGVDKAGNAISIRGVESADGNHGKLCLKGICEFELFDTPNRGTSPLIRERIFEPFQETPWDNALTKTAS
jgi:assimilatory nitrate reductase catalytic subunit